MTQNRAREASEQGSTEWHTKLPKYTSWQWAVPQQEIAVVFWRRSAERWLTAELRPHGHATVCHFHEQINCSKFWLASKSLFISVRMNCIYVCMAKYFLLHLWIIFSFISLCCVLFGKYINLIIGAGRRMMTYSTAEHASANACKFMRNEISQTLVSLPRRVTPKQAPLSINYLNFIVLHYYLYQQQQRNEDNNRAITLFRGKIQMCQLNKHQRRERTAKTSDGEKEANIRSL